LEIQQQTAAVVGARRVAFANSGAFLQITCDDAADIGVPGPKDTFGIVKAAEARGDSQVLAERSRKALRVHRGPDVAAGRDQLLRAIRQALA
jgi:transaldolase / glucose-6-phosphate isomerase